MRAEANLLWLLALGASLLSGCKPIAVPPQSASATDIDCFPAEARKWISTDETMNRSNDRTSGPVTIYVDHSGSMAGYLRAERGDTQPFRDLIATIPISLGIDNRPIRRILFGKTLRELPASSATDLLEEDTYSCKDHSNNCDNQESRLDLALSAIAAENSQNLSFLVSDLWLEDSEILTSGAVAMAEPLKKILTSGRSIALYGIPAPYIGKIYDLPSGRDLSINAKRPLFLLVVGPVDRLNQFDSALPRSPSRYLANGVQSGVIKHSLFTLTPGRSAAISPKPFEGVNPIGGISPGLVMSARRGVNLQRLVVQPQGATAALSGKTPSDSQLPRWTGPREVGVLTGAVWRGPVKTQTFVWKLQRDAQERCAATDWIPWGLYPGGWADAPGADQASFVLRPDELSLGLAQSGVYLITGQVVRTSLDTPNPADAWMRNWSFAPEDEVNLTPSPQELFPTLNLSETARLLENVLAVSAERSPTVVAGFSVAIKLNR